MFHPQAWPLCAIALTTNCSLNSLDYLPLGLSHTAFAYWEVVLHMRPKTANKAIERNFAIVRSLACSSAHGRR